MWADHDSLAAAPGGYAVYGLAIQAKGAAQDVSLSYDALPDGLSAAFDPSTLHVGAAPEPFAKARFGVKVAPDFAATSADVTVRATSTSGAEAHALLHLRIEKPSPTASSWVVRAEPASQAIRAGGNATYVLHVKAARNVTVELALGRHSGEGYSARIEPSTLTVPGGGEAKAVLTLAANATPDKVVGYQVVATGSDGAERSVAVKAELARPAPLPTPTPTAPQVTLEGADASGGILLAVRVDGHVYHFRLALTLVPAATGGDLKATPDPATNG